MKKVCVVTATRAEYGLLRWVIEGLKKQGNLKTQVVVTGTHLSKEHGNTYKLIESDGVFIDKKLDYLSADMSSSGIANSMGVCGSMFAAAFSELSPDLLVVLGDRYELLPICSSALVMGIPIAHISGGDVTEGAIDNQIRNAISMMATLHFPGTMDSLGNVVRMTNSSLNIYCTGETNIDNFEHYPLLSRRDLALSLKLNAEKKWILATLHPETRLSVLENLQMTENMMQVLLQKDAEIVMTEANADFVGREINDYLRSIEQDNKQMHLFKSLGQQRYLSCMKEVCCVIGNSSSGIVEAPHLGIPVVNIGNRQKGRHVCSNVFNCEGTKESIACALNKAFEHGRFAPDDYFGDGHSSEKIVQKIIEYLE